MRSNTRSMLEVISQSSAEEFRMLPEASAQKCGFLSVDLLHSISLNSILAREESVFAKRLRVAMHNVCLTWNCHAGMYERVRDVTFI